MYRTVAQLDSLSALLAGWFPQYFHRERLPEASVQGRPVHALRLRAGTAGDRRGVLVVGGTHARELMNPDAVLELAVDLFGSHVNGTDLVYGGKTWTAQEIRTILETLDLWFVPCVNPDGREHVLTVDDLWRKNRRDNPGTTCDGVDLNRNADFVWGVTEGQTSCSLCSDVYCGPAAASEPETRNVRHLLDAHRMVSFVDVHSYSELVLWPWGHAPTQTTDPSRRFTDLASGTCAPIPERGYQEYMPARDLTRFSTVGDRVVAAIAAVRGRSYTSQTSLGLYPTTGTFSDYAYSRHLADPARAKTYGFTFETGPWVGNARDSFHPADPTQIKRDAKSGLIALMQQSICAIDLIGLEVGGRRTLTSLRRIRDDVLASTEAGREWIGLVERIQADLATAVLTDRELAGQAAAAFRRVGSLTHRSRSAKLTQDDLALAADLVRGMSRRVADPDRVGDLEQAERRLAALSGRTLAEAVEDLMARPPRVRAPAGA